MPPFFDISKIVDKMLGTCYHVGMNYEIDCSYQHIKYFLVVAAKKNISKAAQHLGITQSALSQAMKSLEESLGVTLFYRNTKGIELTEEGEIFYQNAIAGDVSFRQAITKTLQNNNFKNFKTFKIGASESIIDFFILPKIREIKKEFPSLNIEFVGRIREIDVQKSLQNDKIDLILFKSSRDIIMKQVVCERVKKLEYAFMYNPKFFSLPKQMSMAELSKYDVVIKRRENTPENFFMMSAFPKIIIVCTDTSARNFIKEGAGIGNCEKEACEALGLKQVIVTDLQERKHNVFVAYEEHNDLAKKVAKLLF